MTETSLSQASALRLHPQRPLVAEARSIATYRDYCLRPTLKNYQVKSKLIKSLYESDLILSDEATERRHRRLRIMRTSNAERDLRIRSSNGPATQIFWAENHDSHRKLLFT